MAGIGRVLPAEARGALRGWLMSEELRPAMEQDAASVRAHQRLLREFLREHLMDGRPLQAFESWEGGRWTPPGSGPGERIDPPAPDAAEPVGEGA
jgi:DNA repair protein RecO (recombination protein O)